MLISSMNINGKVNCINILGVDVNVHYVSNEYLLEKLDGDNKSTYLGLFEPISLEIFINEDIKSDYVHNTTILHECVHALNFIYYGSFDVVGRMGTEDVTDSFVTLLPHLFDITVQLAKIGGGIDE